MSSQQGSEPSTTETSSELTHIVRESKTRPESEPLSWFSKGGLWSSAQSYLGRIAAAVQEETQGLTLDKVKKDLEEFSQQLYSEVQGMQSAISKESQKQKESGRGVTTDSILPMAPFSKDWNNWSEQIAQSSVGSVQTKGDFEEEKSSHCNQEESVVVDNVSYWVPKPFCHLIDPFLSNYRKKALEVHTNPALFLDSNVSEDELQQFGKEMEETIEFLSPQVLHHCTTLKEVYEWNVPAKIDSCRFWSLYFYKLDAIAKEEMTKQSIGVVKKKKKQLHYLIQ
ncbi:uncharacterized protein Gasu_35320 [Galdieria sulphuraria]|uniref:BSD domain-containing protein n=1 Tax=Galdieria sulphuraria TaxID=130081 RepID=M2XG01_GALSU|nr:uncharacterized protein Gasu_35320 [Galdieria sulphuraria]EME28957.1 hypothetical protein Gasu_35320 [Galdieria sulphuraria]|eukprot:XP_005705477.1 hypothetical protein Gasu_35320 [Galdieria sulphuraria]